MLAALTIPIITNLAVDHFDTQGDLGLHLGKVVQVIGIVLIPVGIGMAVRLRSADFVARADRPVRIFSIAVLVVVAVGVLLGERENLADYVQRVGLVTGIFCLASNGPARIARQGCRPAGRVRHVYRSCLCSARSVSSALTPHPRAAPVRPPRRWEAL